MNIKIMKKEHGKVDGEAKSYYKSGELKSRENWKDGKQNGEWKDYYKSGELQGIVDYKGWQKGW